MLLRKSLKKKLIEATVLFFIVLTGQHYAAAADEAEPSFPQDELIVDSPDGSRSAEPSKRDEVSDLLSRIEALEQQIKYMQRDMRVLDRQVGTSRTLVNMVNEGKSLASDAWDIAVEARTIAIRAEQKAEQARREAAR
ncbi:MAG: hypothetical protein P1P81_11690 [Desulfobulbales bacterium]|nr:hypothetical protein [Desulfobulbales bacterium]